MTTLGLHRWAITGFAIFLGYAVVSLLAPEGYALAAFANIVQFVLLAAFLAMMLLNMRVARAHAQIFWGAMAAGAALWLAGNLMETWLELTIRKGAMNPVMGDALDFIHIVPMMGALALRPHRPERDRRLEFGGLDFALLLLWWSYLYVFIVLPWHYVVPNVGLFNFSFNILYVLENGIFLGSLVILCYRSSGAWRRIYAQFLIAGTIYALASQAAAWAMGHGHYYPGCIYELPLVAGMVWFLWAGLVAYRLRPEAGKQEVAREHGVLASRLAMIAVLSIPLLAFWTYLASTAPHEVVMFRLVISLGALFVLPFLVFLKQHLLDRELIRLLGKSQHNYENLKRVQGQLVLAEKLASLGQLVAGAAHEINNPLTAIIGYSDLLATDTSLPAEQSGFVQKIGQQARRTHELVTNLLTFAKEIPADKWMLLNINSVVSDAVELCALDLPQAVRIERQLAPNLPPVFGDSNQLLQVCFHIIGNSVDAMKQAGSGVLKVSSREEKGQIIIEFADTGPGVREPEKIFDPFYSTKPVGKGAGLGLSACYGIVRAHKGQIYCQNEGGAVFVVMLPAGKVAAANAGS